MHAEEGWGETITTADLDGDGDQDLLLASPLESNAEVAVFWNKGNGTFGPKHVLNETPYLAATVDAADLDQDGHLDVIWGSWSDEQLIGWFENLGDGSFGDPRIISEQAASTKTVTAADLNRDGFPDVLSASFDDDKIAWYENLGGSFADQRPLNRPDPDGPEGPEQGNADGAASVLAADLDGDGWNDVVTGSYADGKIAWHRNLGGEFGPQQVITEEMTSILKVYTSDLNGDGDPDILAAYEADQGNLAWLENLGGEFGKPRVISSDSSGATSVRAADLDGDGDRDVVATSEDDDKVTWYENLGDRFGPQQVISTAFKRPDEVVPSDVDGDGDPDLLVSYSSSQDSMMIALFENREVSVATEPSPELPATVRLEPAYPNPFNPTTTIAYHLPQRTHVSLQVFDAVGRPVATLVDAARSSGRHRVRFDAAGLSSGTYLYRLETSRITRTRIMMLMK